MRKHKPEAPAPKRPEFLAVQEILDRETAYIAGGGTPRVFYHPGYSCNGHFDTGAFQKHRCPPGWELDVEAWERGGRQGPAPLKPMAPFAESEAGPVPVEEKKTNG